MADILTFKPRPEWTAEKNRAEFISLSRDKSTVFGADLNWSSNKWDGVVVFSKLGVTTRKPTADQCMDDEFIEFAKAYFRYQQGTQPSSPKNESKALRAVEAALLQVNACADPSKLSITVLDEAAALARQHYSSNSAYQCGQEIERLAKFVTENKLVPAGLQGWRNPITRTKDTTRTGIVEKEKRANKLPDETALNALAEIFANDPDEDRDIFTTSVFAMLMSAPSRISEVLSLPIDCEVTQIDRDGKQRYGWRFYAGKGFAGDIKWIPTEMEQVARIAVGRAKKLSENARAFAKWIEHHPSKFYRHADCPDIGDHEPLSMQEVCCALGLKFKTTKVAKRYLADQGLPSADYVITLNDLWEHVFNRLPNDFPWFDKEKNIKYSEALFVFSSNQLHKSKGTNITKLQKANVNMFNNDLKVREGVKNHKSIFQRHGFFGNGAEELKVTSHQARHLLNTIAQRGGLSNMEIAKWSGRADVKQNRTYNHMTDDEMVAISESLDTSKELFGPTDEIPQNMPVTTQDFNSLEHGAAHATEYGFCVHDYTIGPCEKFRDCLNCTEHVCVKGDKDRLERIKKTVHHSEKLIEKAQRDIANGDMGADRWYQSHLKTVERSKQLISILEDPDTDDGTQVKLTGNDFSQLRRVTYKKAIEKDENNQVSIEEAHMLDDLTKALGGGFG